jgi:DNA-directed RNA polymerase specialized sigma24 family protein
MEESSRLEKLVATYGYDINYWLSRKADCYNPNDREDVRQEVLIALMRIKPEKLAQARNERNYMATCIRNAIGMYRRNTCDRRPIYVLHDFSHDHMNLSIPSAESSVESGILYRRVVAAIDELPSFEAILVRLYFGIDTGEPMTIKDTFTVLNRDKLTRAGRISVRLITDKLHKAVRILRVKLKKTSSIQAWPDSHLHHPRLQQLPLRALGQLHQALQHQPQRRDRRKLPRVHPQAMAAASSQSSRQSAMP